MKYHYKIKSKNSSVEAYILHCFLTIENFKRPPWFRFRVATSVLLRQLYEAWPVAAKNLPPNDNLRRFSRLHSYHRYRIIMEANANPAGRQCQNYQYYRLRAINLLGVGRGEVNLFECVTEEIHCTLCKPQSLHKHGHPIKWKHNYDITNYYLMLTGTYISRILDIV